VTAGFLLPFELGVVLVVVDLVVILWLVYDTSSRERRKKKLYSIALVLARLVGLPSFGLELWPSCFLTLVVVADLGAGFRQVRIGRR